MADTFVLAPTLIEDGMYPVFSVEPLEVAALPSLDREKLITLFLRTHDAFSALQRSVSRRWNSDHAVDYLRDVQEVLREGMGTAFIEQHIALTTAGKVQQLISEQKRLVSLLQCLAESIGAPRPYGEVEEVTIQTAVARLQARAGTEPRLPQVLELVRQAHHTVLMGSAPQTKGDLGDAARLLAAIIDGRV